MGRIDTILEQAASSTSNLQDALLQCVILADELNYEPLKSWANREIAGYPSYKDLPEYRIARSALRGTLVQGLTSKSGFTIPNSWIDKDLLDAATTIYSTKGIGYLASLKDDGTLAQHHPDRDIIEDSINMRLEKANGPFVHVESVSLTIPPGYQTAIMSAVRHRLVEFMLELKKVFPDQENLAEAAAEKRPQVESSFHRNVLHVDRVDTINIVQNQNNTDRSHHITFNVSKGDLDSLSHYLSDLGVEPGRIELFRPIAERLAQGDGSAETEESIREWIEELPEKGMQAAGEGAKKAIVEGVFQGLMKYAPRMASWLSNVDVPFV